MSAVKRLQRLARPDAKLGVVTDLYRGDRKAVLRLLNEALATEIVCMLRYRRHHFMAKSLASARIAEEFLVHADEELAQADLIADRIVQLGGEPDFAPDTLKERSHAEYLPATTVVEMLREDLVAERVAIASYHSMIKFLGESDPTTRRMLEGILGIEEAHADELLDLLEGDTRAQ
ncbi:MAG TPA: ferritin-like domain-containing protein [Steroidobacteraceae bacterium]|nr:ferritin-like domain-containing protein [Steroidobacteraceae bacterium]